MEILRWRDGRLVPDPEAEVTRCRGFTHGLGVFETMLGVRGNLLAADLHFRRLAEGCRRMGMEEPDARSWISEMESRLDPQSVQRVRLQVSCGPGGLRSLDGGEPVVLLEISAAAGIPTALSLVLAPWPRNERSPLAAIKSCSYAGNLLALDFARRQGADEAVFANTRGELCEAATANVFLVLDGTVVTPGLESGCLPGTARERVIAMARGLGMEVREEAVGIGSCAEADEVFLTSATRGVVAACRFESVDLPPGPVTRRLRKAVVDAWWGGT